MTDLELFNGDCREIMASWPAASIDAIVTDPPYDLVSGNARYDLPLTGSGSPRVRRAGFMGKSWDGTGVAFEPATWAAALRLLKPGGYLVAFGGPRTYHRLACAVEDAGFELRDCLMWIFGSGFPKSLNLHGEHEGWGTALKPAYEPIVLARKPLAGTVAANVEAHGTGALNIAASRIGEADTRHTKAGGANDFPREDDRWTPAPVEVGSASGRWPANIMFDEEAARLLDAASGSLTSGSGEPFNRNVDKFRNTYSHFEGAPAEAGFYGDQGGASRFFYTSKASRTEREAWLEDVDPSRRSDGREKDIENPRLRTNARRNDHPTVKPVDLMRWLCTLITPPHGLILDPFMGSGSTGMAALDAGFRFRGIDQDPHYVELARGRIEGRHTFAPPPPPAADNQAPRLL